MDVKTVALSDTIGVSNSTTISSLFSNLISEYPSIEFGAHFHTTKDSWRQKVDVAYRNGCKRFDGALNGYGGCPMAKDELVGNMPTENLITYFKDELEFNMQEFEKSLLFSTEIF